MFLPFSIVFDNFFGYCFIKCSKELVPPLCPHAINSSCVKALQLRIESLLKHSYIHPPPVPTGLCIFEVLSTSARKMATTIDHAVHDLKYRDPPSQLLSWKSVHLSRWRPSILRRSLCIVSGSIQCLSFEVNNSTCSDTKSEGVFCLACLHSGRPAEKQ